MLKTNPREHHRGFYIRTRQFVQVKVTTSLQNCQMLHQQFSAFTVIRISVNLMQRAALFKLFLLESLK